MQHRQSMARRALLIIGLITSLLPAWWPSGVSASPAAQAETPVTLRLAMPAPNSLDPVQLSRFDPATRDLVESLFVGLAQFDPYSGQIAPMLAKNTTVSDDGLTWTFELRDDVQWVRFDKTQDRVVPVRPVVAGDLVYAIHRACDPRRPSPVTTNLMVIQGCMTVTNAFSEAINDVFLAREIGVRATGPNTLEIKLLFPTGFLNTLLSTPETRPLPRETVSAVADWTSADNIISDGPFVLRDSTASGMTLVRNPYWPDPLPGNIEQIEVTFTSTSTSAVDLIASHRVDYVRLDATNAANGHTTLPGLFHTSDGITMTLLGFSHDRAVVSQPDVRRALSYAIDRQALAQQLFPDQMRAADGLVPRNVIAAPSTDENLYDPVRAQAYLESAGYANCNGIPEPLTLLVPDDDPVWLALGQAITQQWTAVLGCNPALFNVDTVSRSLLIDMAHSTYDPEKVTRSHIWLTAWSADYPDANAWLSDTLQCQFGYIRTGRECSDADTAMDRAAAEDDATARASLYTQAEQSLVGPNGSFPVTPLFLSTQSWLQQPWLSNVNDSGAARFDSWTIDVSQQ